ncbi:MAG: hypothetical protein CMH56_14655 [Myxococcales bacterium]|nr:hypothetical protein [Myxococcales bacterium]|tara:strand:+ start:312 stop:1514 length:1203 start_codon:yes stop_codon:yes gene_type:complete
MSPPNAFPKIAYGLLVGAAFLLLFQELGVAFEANFGTDFNQDIPEFVEGALGSTYFYDSGLREPFHVFCLKIGLGIVENQEQAVRLVTVAQSLFCAFGLWFFARVFFGSTVALLSLWLLAINPVLIFYGVSGMRAPIYTGLLLTFLGALGWEGSRQTTKIWGAIGVGVMGGLLVLTRRYALAIVVGTLILNGLGLYFWNKERLRAWTKKAAMMMGTALLLLLPDVVLHETPAFRDNINFFRNLEFHGHAGAFRESPPVSFFHYVFVDHSLSEVVTIVGTNIMNFPQDYLGYFFRGYGFAWVLVWVATLLAAFHLRFFLATAVAWLSLAPIVFVLHLDQVPFGKGVENRLVLQTFALFLPVVVATVFHLFGLALYKILGDHERLGPMINDWIERLDIKTLR